MNISPKLNVKLLRKIQRQIRKEPKQFIMDEFFKDGPRIPNCGTAACIAGWTVTLTQTKSKKPSEVSAYDSVWFVAKTALGLANEYVAGSLFIEDHWPKQFQGSKKTLATRAIARIDHFIKTGA